MEASLTVILIVAVCSGLYMAWGIGANDVANSMGTSVGSGAITVGTAIVIAGVFEFLGAFLAGGEVASTIRKGIIDADALGQDSDLLVIGMLSALLAAAVWLTVASRYGWPVSTTHSIVGAIIGFAVVAVGFEAVRWWGVAKIVASWVVTPVLAGGISFLLVLSVQWLIFNKDDPAVYARRYVPVYIFAAVLITSVVTFVKGLKHVGLDLGTPMAILYSVLLAAVIACAGRVVINRMSFEGGDSHSGGGSRFTNVERAFGVLMIITASGMAFAHGSNDVANAIGPLAAIIGVVTTGAIASKSAVPPWLLLVGAVGIVVGLATFGYRVMATIGRKITELTPSRGFAAEFAAASTVVVASGTGLPVSTTQTLVKPVPRKMRRTRPESMRPIGVFREKAPRMGRPRVKRSQTCLQGSDMERMFCIRSSYPVRKAPARKRHTIRAKNATPLPYCRIRMAGESEASRFTGSVKPVVKKKASITTAKMAVTTMTTPT